MERRRPMLTALPQQQQPTPSPHLPTLAMPTLKRTTTAAVNRPLKKKTFRKIGSRCRKTGCTERPWFADPGAKVPKACKGHKRDGEVNVYKPSCQKEGCSTRPTYGEDGGRARFCCLHKLDDMVDVLNKKCGAQGCRKQPSWAEARGARALFCKDHKQEGMVDTKHKTCAHPGCPLLPSMGVAVDQDTVNTIPASGQRSTSTLRSGKASARYCAAHAPEGSTNVTARRCRHPGCNVQPTFGREGAGEAPSFCARHRKPGMTDVLNPRCHARGCVAQPRCGRVGDPRPTFCLHHADPDMVNVRSANYRETTGKKRKTQGDPCADG